VPHARIVGVALKVQKIKGLRGDSDAKLAGARMAILHLAEARQAWPSQRGGTGLTQANTTVRPPAPPATGTHPSIDDQRHRPVNRSYGNPEWSVNRCLACTAPSKRVLELSIEEARQLGHDYTPRSTCCWGVMKEGESIAAKILESLGARLDEVRRETLALSGDPQIRATETRAPTREDVILEAELPPRVTYGPPAPPARMPSRQAADAEAAARFDDIIGGTPRMREIFATVSLVAKTDVTVLVEGESGTGKELLAHTIHHKSRRKNAPFVAINCGAIA